MTFIEMIKHLKNGKKARKVSWEDDCYLEFDPEKRIYIEKRGDDITDRYYYFDDYDIEAEWVFEGKEEE